MIVGQRKKERQKKRQASALSADFLHRTLSGALSLLNKKKKKEEVSIGVAAHSGFFCTSCEL